MLFICFFSSSNDLIVCKKNMRESPKSIYEGLILLSLCALCHSAYPNYLVFGILYGADGLKHGFRPQRSTMSALSELQQRWAKNSDAARLWNRAPDSIKNCKSIYKAKVEIKKFIGTLPI